MSIIRQDQASAVKVGPDVLDSGYVQVCVAAFIILTCLYNKLHHKPTIERMDAHVPKRVYVVHSQLHFSSTFHRHKPNPKECLSLSHAHRRAGHLHVHLHVTYIYV